MRSVFSLLVCLLLGLVAASVGTAHGQQGRGKPGYVLTVVATDTVNTGKRTVPAMTSGDYFVEVLIPANAAVTRQGQRGRVPLSAIRPAVVLVCKGNWTDATRSVFRATSVTVSGKLSSTVYDKRFAAACRRITVRSKSNAPAPTPAAPVPTPAPAATRNVTDVFVVESTSLERRDDLPAQEGTGLSAYTAEGTARNISGQTFETVEVQLSILDRQGRKVADQTAKGSNVRTGDRWKFQGTPPLYLANRDGHTVRVEKITGQARR